MNRERQGFHIPHVYSLWQGFHISYVYSLWQDLSHHTIILSLVTLTLNFESHTQMLLFKFGCFSANFVVCWKLLLLSLYSWNIAECDIKQQIGNLLAGLQRNSGLWIDVSVCLMWTFWFSMCIDFDDMYLILIFTCDLDRNFPHFRSHSYFG